MEMRAVGLGKRGGWKGGREDEKRGVEGFDRDVSASDRRCVVSMTSPGKTEDSPADDPGVPTAPPFPVCAGFTSSSGELTSCMRSSPPKRFGSRNSSPS